MIFTTESLAKALTASLERGLRLVGAGHTMFRGVTVCPAPTSTALTSEERLRSLAAGETRLQAQIRQARYMQAAAERSDAARKLRLERMEHEVGDYKVARSRAQELVASIDTGQVRLRSGFVRCSETTTTGRRSDLRRRNSADVLSTRPPVGRLMRRRSRAVSLYLVGILDAQAHTPPGSSPSNRRSLSDRVDGWSVLLGETLDRRQRLSRMLLTLEAAGLVELPPARENRRFDRFKLLAEDGRGSAYTTPGEARSLPLPVHFFNCGWHLVLEPTEIATYLMIWDMSYRHFRSHETQGVGVAPLERRASYGLSDEVYESHRELAEFGLITMSDSVAERRNGRVRRAAEPASDEPSSLPTYQFRIVPDLQDDALEVVTSLLPQRAPRFMDDADLLERMSSGWA